MFATFARSRYVVKAAAIKRGDQLVRHHRRIRAHPDSHADILEVGDDLEQVGVHERLAAGERDAVDAGSGGISRVRMSSSGM